MILNIVAEDYRFQSSKPRVRAGYATVCREWQLVFEQRNFQRLILDQERICNLKSLRVRIGNEITSSIYSFVSGSTSMTAQSVNLKKMLKQRISK
jgi:hypothetical protein